jgi:hypothetical protein
MSENEGYQKGARRASLLIFVQGLRVVREFQAMVRNDYGSRAGALERIGIGRSPVQFRQESF